ncbi:glycosyltransferase 87 family protein [Nocardia paucivorans]|uniref:glycosyltransferase 87 family protein n=1 Tax=Nocardia paucivorans TaxID=114259 RepID=UPI000688B7CD|nr:glycosyltransferase 87 family protein [Nocardia paucivorans]
MRRAPTTTTTTPAGSRVREFAVWLLPLLAAAVTAVCLGMSLGPFERISGDYIDLEVYRLGVEEWRSGGDLYGELPKTGIGISLPFIYPPFAALALGVFALVPWTVSMVAYLVTSVGALALTLYLVARQLWPETGRARTALLVCATATPPALLLEPVFATLDFGQVNLLLMGLVAADCLTRNPRWPRGLLIGIAAAIKLTPAAFVLFLLVRRDYRAAVTATVSGAAATLVGFVVLPDESVRYWFGGFGNVDGLSGSAFHTNQSFQAVLTRLEITGPVATALWVVLSAALVALAVVAMRRPGTPPSIALAVNAIVALLVSPISWSHHWVWVAPAILAMTGYAIRQPGRDGLRWYIAATLTIVVFIAAPHGYLPGENNRELDWTPIQQVIGDTYVWFGLLLVVFVVIAARRSAPEEPRIAPEPSDTLVGSRDQ